MTDNTKTWSVMALVTIMLLIVLFLFEKQRKGTTTQTSVGFPDLPGAGSTFPVRGDNNQILLRQCTYNNGHVLTLDPNAAGGQCPPVYAGLDGVPGNLTKDEVIVVPNAGQSTVMYPGGE